jgi:CRP/FNR family transcriptional regulator, cyclic AMP receptor protein
MARPRLGERPKWSSINVRLRTCIAGPAAYAWRFGCFLDTPKFPHHRDCEALTGITLDHLPRDGSLGRIRRFAKGAFLWRPDDEADCIYFLRTGRVVVTTAKPDERPVALHTIEPEQPFGELCLCSVRAGIRGTTANAVIATEVLEIKLSSFLGYVHQNPAALNALMFTLCLRLTDAEHRIEVMAHRGAEQRLGRLLLRLSTSRGRRTRVGRKEMVGVTVSHNALAQLAGMSRPHVTVTMGRLRRRRLVQYDGQGLVRVDVASLTDYLGRIVRGERA